MGKKQNKIHPEIKKRLGFEEIISDKEFLKIWKRKSTQVCKPCWELKYCPYGPFVEQSPLLPTIKKEATEHNEYLLSCLRKNSIGEKEQLSQERINSYKRKLQIVKRYPKFLLPEVLKKKYNEERIKEGEERGLDFFELYQTPYKNFEKYQVPFPLDERKDDILKELDRIVLTPELNELVKKEIEEIKKIIKTGIIDRTRPLDGVRKRSFEKIVSEFNPDDYPEHIPNQIYELKCSIFGHICPVVFVGESITETSEKRRKGRYISFKTKMRVVRRDNYTCQSCSCHLQDDEVEFDHIIPVSKGGSSEEHNIRLTCFRCNRDKLDTVQI